MTIPCQRCGSVFERLTNAKFCAPCSSGRKLAVDHDAETGEVRGLLCGSCNLGIGKFRHSVGRLLEAVRYLDKHRSELLETMTTG